MFYSNVNNNKKSKVEKHSNNSFTYQLIKNKSGKYSCIFTFHEFMWDQIKANVLNETLRTKSQSTVKSNISMYL